MITEYKSYLFSLNKIDNEYLKPFLICSFDTCSNPKAIGWLLSRKDRNVVILPDIKEKCVQIYDSSVENNLVVYDLKTTPTILSGNIYGDVFAYANINGKTIYVHNLIDGTLQMEFDRGGDYAEINCIAFEKYWRRMAITSNKDTIHWFTLPKDWVTEQTEGNFFNISLS